MKRKPKPTIEAIFPLLTASKTAKKDRKDRKDRRSFFVFDRRRQKKAGKHVRRIEKSATFAAEKILLNPALANKNGTFHSNNNSL